MASMSTRSYTQGMGRRYRQLRRYIRAAIHDRYIRLFPEPTETRLIQILGGTTLTIGAVRRDNKPMTIIVSTGRLLRSERFRRSVLDDEGILANDVQMAIKIQGPEYEMDVVKEFEMDERLSAAGWRMRVIPRRWLYENPDRVRTFVKQFIYN